ncbi:MAG: hypothetical protein MdMp014T_0710 [Treponematales bacterium]
MTLPGRNLLLKAAIVFAAAVFIAAAAAAFTAFPAYPEAAETAAGRPSGAPNLFGETGPGAVLALAPAAYAPLAAALLAAFYAFAAIILIHYFFEKTQTPEIAFIALFTLSLSCEAARTVIPLSLLTDFPNFYLTLAARFLLFGRNLGLFALFTASVYAAGLTERKQHNAVFVCVIAALIIALGFPVDSLTWDTSLSMTAGYSPMFALIETGIALAAAAGFFVSAYSRGEKEYLLIGAGSLLAFLGRHLLLTADNWAAPFPGFLLLALGTWHICARLHAIYLWF